MNRLRGILLAGLVLALFVVPVRADDLIVNPGRIAANNSVNVGVVWSSLNVGYLVYMTTDITASAELNWIKTVDGGVNWSSPVTIVVDAGQTKPVAGFGIWYDRWTQGQIGTKIHIGYSCRGTGTCGGATSTTGALRYISLDTNTDVLSSDIKVADYGGSAAVDDGGITITKTNSGLVYLLGISGASLSTQRRMGISATDGASWVSGFSVGSAGTLPIQLAPALISTAFNDVYALDFDNDVLQYDFDTDTWSRIFTATPSFSKSFSIAVNPTSATPTGNPYVFYGYLSAPDTVTYEDFIVFRQSGLGTVVEVTPVFENTGTNFYQGALIWDDTHDVLYAVYIDIVTDQVFYKSSDDSGATWSAQSRFDNSLNAKSDIAIASTVTRSGGRFMPIWEESGTLVTELDNDIELSTAVELDEQDFDNKIVRFVDGLGLRGDSGKTGFAALGGTLLVVMLLFRAPVIVFLSLEMLWFGAMAAIAFITPGLFLTMLVIFGILMIFAILARLTNTDSTGGL